MSRYRLPIAMTIVLASAPFAFAWQQSTVPALHQRSATEGETSNEPRETTSRLGSTLPEDVSGAYEFRHRDESIEIDLDQGKLSGYISRRGDEESDTSTPLTFMFDRTNVDGSQLEFQTKVLHGIWYSFEGTVFRGNGKTRSDEGFYVLHGTLREHHSMGEGKAADETVESWTVNYKSIAQ